MNKPILAEGHPSVTNPRSKFYSSHEVLWKTLFLIFIQLLLLLWLAGTCKAQCALFCNDNIRISLDGSCMAEVTYRMVLEDPDNPLVCYPTEPSNFKVVLMDRFNRVIPGSPYLTSAHIGQTITAKVIHLPSGNNCWGTVTVFDNMPPLLVCPPDTIIGCASSADTSVLRQPF